MDEQLLDSELIAKQVEALGFKPPLPDMAEKIAAVDQSMGGVVISLALKAKKDQLLLMDGFNRLGHILGVDF